jgi:hypothetical protein
VLLRASLSTLDNYLYQVPLAGPLRNDIVVLLVSFVGI